MEDLAFRPRSIDALKNMSKAQLSARPIRRLRLLPEHQY